MNFAQSKYKKRSKQDKICLSICFDLLKLISPPIYSHFRVVALISYINLKGDFGYVIGTNAESSFIGGSICAERVCINKLREIKITKVKKIYIISDDNEYITPGDLCREFLLDQLPDKTKVVMCGSSSCHEATLISLYPHPPLYRGIDSRNVQNYAKIFSKKIDTFQKSDKFFDLYKKTITTTGMDANSQYHPIKFAAGVQFEDNSIEVVWQNKLIEYGTTTDPVAKLVVLLEFYRGKNIKPVCIIQVDQYGVLHAPFAEGRANLFENGFKDTLILVHDKNGKIKHTNSSKLSPNKLK